MRILIPFILAVVAIAGEQPADLAAKLKAAEQATRLARLEALVLREQIAAQQLEKIRADQQALFAEACKAAGIDPDPKVCVIDLNTHSVAKRTEPPAKEGTK